MLRDDAGGAEPARTAGDTAAARGAGRDGAEAGAARAPRGGADMTQAAAPSALPLTQGELTDAEAAELVALKRQIQQTVGFVCEGYKEKCLRRRIAVRMRARGVHGYADYGRLLMTDRTEYERLVDTLTINVSKFQRNPDVWKLVRERVLPDLYAMDTPEIRVWSAGTASGEEAYTLGMFAHEYAAAQGVVDRVRVLGTDIDRESLLFARRAEYTDFAMTDIEPVLRDRWFRRCQGMYRLQPEALRHVRFDTLDLIRDPYPQDQHLICCRNVIIYFERVVQEDLFRRFHDALVPGGYLVLGKVEALFGAATGLFHTVANRQRVFRKP
jgi:chemotaxis protein methyltransferase CheR